MRRKTFLFILFQILTFILPLGSWAGEAEVIETVEVAKVWAGHPVRFCLLTKGEDQFVGFYNGDRNMVVGQRKLGSSEWLFHELSEHVVWDSHNYITIHVDDDGFLHLSGNMHVDPLVYFRTTKPLDIRSFERIDSMVGELENRTTYPRFFRGPKSELIFTYRDGKSGSGNQIYNVYDHGTKTWSRLLEKPLTDGEGKRNAYLHGPLKGPDGYFHLCWVWRDTFDCATNHNLSYARSSDLIHWEKSSGERLELPITLDSGEIVDPVPPGGGIINGATLIGFDHQKRIVIAYHKHDENGNTQIYHARREREGWKIYKVTDWDYRWEFSGGGSIINEIHLSAVAPIEEGKLSQSYGHSKFGGGLWILDEKDFSIIETREKKPRHPRELSKKRSRFPKMRVNCSPDLGHSGEEGIRYALRWETLPRNRDRPHEGEIPPPGMLEVVKIRESP